MCLYIIFVAAAFAAPVPAVCGILAALLQYFMLVYLAWTAVEAFYLYMKLVQVLGTHIQKYVLKATLIAWCKCKPFYFCPKIVKYENIDIHFVPHAFS